MDYHVTLKYTEAFSCKAFNEGSSESRDMKFIQMLSRLLGRFKFGRSKPSLQFSLYYIWYGSERSEGLEWKHHRNANAPYFNKKNNVLVFAEGCDQTLGSLRKWTGVDGMGNIAIDDVPKDSDRLTLHIVSRMGFGMRLLWPGEKLSQKQNPIDTYCSDEPPEGHFMSFENALNTQLEHLLWVLIQKWMLSKCGLDIPPSSS